MLPKSISFMDTGDSIFLGRISEKDKALPRLSPSANPAGFWESIEQ